MLLDLTLRLSCLFGTSVEFWLNGWMTWELYHAMHAPDAADLDRIAPVSIAPENSAP